MNSCDCLEKIRLQLEKQHHNVCLDLKMRVNIKTGESCSDLPPLYFTYHKPNSKGFEKRATRSFVFFAFCPFCGKPKS
jgi:hypothetical protein